MKRRRKLLILAAVLVAAVLTVVLWPQEKEPEYQGKRLSEWMGTYRPGSTSPALRKLPMLLAGTRWLDRNGHSEEEVVHAVRSMGPEGMQFMVRWVAYEPPAWRQKVLGYLGRLPKSAKYNHLYRWLAQGYDDRAGAAAATLSNFSREELPMEQLEHIEANTNRPYAARRVQGMMNLMAMKQGWMRSVTASRATNQIKGIHYGLKPELLPVATSPFEPLP